MDLLRSIVRLWAKQIGIAKKHKRKHFGLVSKKIRRYYRTSQRYISREEYDSEESQDENNEDFMTPIMQRRVCVGKVGEFIRILLPHLHYRVPDRLVDLRQDQLPPELQMFIIASAQAAVSGQPPEQIMLAMEAQQEEMGPMPTPPNPLELQNQLTCWELTHSLNYAADDGTWNLRAETRAAVQEALLTGAGLVWHELIDTPYGEFPGSFFESEANLLLDPDQELRRHCSYAIRIRRQSVWRLAEEFNLDAEVIQQQVQTFRSHAKQAEDETYPLDQIPAGDLSKGDVVTYYEIYSRMGMGQKLVARDDELDKVRGVLEAIGDHIYLAIIPGMEHPLNLPPDALTTETNEALLQRLQWPIPFFGDYSDPWPFTFLEFYPDKLWPKPPLEDVLPLQVFLDQAWSFLMSRAKMTARAIVLYSDNLPKNVKDAILNDADMTAVPCDLKAKIADMVHLVEFSPLNSDLWQLVISADAKFDQLTGVNELMRGGELPRQMRSAREADVRQEHVMIRPNDLRDCVDAWQAAIARKEAIAQRLVVREGIAPIFGEMTPGEGMPVPGPLTQHWLSFVATDEPYVAASEFAYTVDASSGRRPNKDRQIANVAESAQAVVPLLTFEYQTTGNPRNVNEWFKDYCIAHDLPPDKYQFLPIPVQQEMSPGEEGGAFGSSGSEGAQ